MARFGLYFITLLVTGTLLLAKTHLDLSVGDLIFQFIGISPWSEGRESGLHYSVLLGMLLVLLGIVGTVQLYKHRYPKILSRIIICGIIILYIFPFITEKAMFMLKHNSTGITSIDYSKNKTKCNFTYKVDQILAQCSISLYNYGKLEEITIKPVDLYHENEAVFESRTIAISPHTQFGLSVQFEGEFLNGTRMTGMSSGNYLELEVNGDKKILY